MSHLLVVPDCLILNKMLLHSIATILHSFNKKGTEKGKNLKVIQFCARRFVDCHKTPEA